jgi:hypothetical protein
VVVLGELQPALFLLSVAVESDFAAVATSAAAARSSAQALGMSLLGAHRYAGAEEDEYRVYEQVLSSYDRTVAALAAFDATVAAELGLLLPPAGGADGVDGRFWDRVARTEAWCFADAVAEPVAAPLSG